MRDTTVQLTHRTAPTPASPRGIDIEPDDCRPVRPILHHVQLKTVRLEEMVEWYSTVLGLVTSHQGSGGAWLTNDDANHRLALMSAPGLRDDPDKVSHAGLHHTAWEYGSFEDLLRTYARLRDRDILPHRTVNHGPVTSFYYLDPDGNSVELQVDNYGDWRESVQFFSTEPFERDPFGPGVDPEALLAALEAGASRRALHQRGYAGEFPPARPNNRRLPT